MQVLTTSGSLADCADLLAISDGRHWTQVGFNNTAIVEHVENHKKGRRKTDSPLRDDHIFETMFSSYETYTRPPSNRIHTDFIQHPWYIDIKATRYRMIHTIVYYRIQNLIFMDKHKKTQQRKIKIMKTIWVKKKKKEKAEI